MSCNTKWTYQQRQNRIKYYTIELLVSMYTHFHDANITKKTIYCNASRKRVIIFIAIA